MNLTSFSYLPFHCLNKLYRSVLEYVLYTVHSMHVLQSHIGLTVPVNIKSIINTVSKQPEPNFVDRR